MLSSEDCDMNSSNGQLTCPFLLFLHTKIGAQFHCPLTIVHESMRKFSLDRATIEGKW